MPEFAPNQKPSSQSFVIFFCQAEPRAASDSAKRQQAPALRVCAYGLVLSATYGWPMAREEPLCLGKPPVSVTGWAAHTPAMKEGCGGGSFRGRGRSPTKENQSTSSAGKKGCQTMSSAERSGGGDPRLRKWPQLHRKPLLYWPVSITNPPRSLRPVLSRRASRASLSVTL